MRKLVYKIEGYVCAYNPQTEEVERKLSLADVIIDNPSEKDIETATKIAYNGEYTIEDDGEPEPTPSQLDVIEAQVAYTAMMTDTLLEV